MEGAGETGTHVFPAMVMSPTADSGLESVLVVKIVLTD